MFGFNFEKFENNYKGFIFVFMYNSDKSKSKLLSAEQSFYLGLLKQGYMILAFLYQFLDFFLNINSVVCDNKKRGSLGSSKCWICSNLRKLTSGGLLKKLWGSAVVKPFAHLLRWIVWNSYYHHVGCCTSAPSWCWCSLLSHHNDQIVFILCKFWCVLLHSHFGWLFQVPSEDALPHWLEQYNSSADTCTHAYWSVFVPELLLFHLGWFIATSLLLSLL